METSNGSMRWHRGPVPIQLHRWLTTAINHCRRPLCLSIPAVQLLARLRTARRARRTIGQRDAISNGFSWHRCQRFAPCTELYLGLVQYTGFHPGLVQLHTGVRPGQYDDRYTERLDTG